MKVLFVSLIFCFGAGLNAATIFHDEDSGLVMEIPGELNRSWDIINHDLGLEINIFNSDCSEEKVYGIGVMKTPLKKLLGEGLESAYPFLLNHLQQSLQETTTLLDDEDFVFEFEELPSLAAEQYAGKRYRFHLDSGDLEGGIYFDIHSFLVNNYSCLIVTTLTPCESEEEIQGFTEKIIKEIRFIE